MFVISKKKQNIDFLGIIAFKTFVYRCLNIGRSIRLTFFVTAAELAFMSFAGFFFVFLLLLLHVLFFAIGIQLFLDVSMLKFTVQITYF
jgi:hypothetical protein